MQGAYERHARPRPRTVVTYLQDVDRPQQRTRGEELLDGRLCVAGEERGEGPELQQSDHGRVVDIALWERTGGVSAARVPDLERRALIEVQALTSARQAIRGPALSP